MVILCTTPVFKKRIERQRVKSEISAIKNDNRMEINITYSAWEADVLEAEKREEALNTNSE